MEKGKLIVIEGAVDGIGKSTQIKILEEKLNNLNVVTHHFPTYDSMQGLLVEEYLKGSFGEIKDLSPYFINTLYAIDRKITWDTKLKESYENGKIILLDRYTTSSLIYQSALIDDIDLKKEFIDYVSDYEYNKLGIKKPDIVFLLTMPFIESTKLRNSRVSNDGIESDIHEKNIEFMKKVYNNAHFVADYLNFEIVNCFEDNRLLSKEEVNQKILRRI